MKLSTMTRAFQNRFGYTQAVEKLCKLGFDCLDMTMTHLGKSDDLLLKDDYAHTIKQMRQIAESYGVSFNQAHAPYHFNYQIAEFFTDEAAKADISFRIKRSIEIAGMLGVKAIIIHPIHNKNFQLEPREYFLDINMKFYGEFADFARQNNVKIAVENMWQKNPYSGEIVADVCSNPYELREYVDRLNAAYGDVFTACLDVGHCALTGVIPEEAVKVLGDRLGAVHIHDNDAVLDKHSLPFTQKIDFPPIMKALKEINYAGEFTFEADYFLEHFPAEHIEAAAEFMCKTGRYLISLTE